MMRKIALTLVTAASSIVTLSQVAFAADLPRRMAPAPVMAPAPTWTGCYIGGNIGAAWGLSLIHI